MSHRIESIAIGSCRRLGRGARSNATRLPPLLRCEPPPPCAASSPSLPTRTTSYYPRIRPPAVSSMGGDILADAQWRGLHLTSIARNDDATAAPALAPTTTAVTSSRTGETIAPFASPKVEALFQRIIWLDMVEVHLLAELINEKMGITISDAERERMARGGGGGRGKRNAEMDDITVEAVVEKTTFDVKLIGFDAKNKIKVIKEVRSMTNLGLKEAKELVEGVPATLRKNIKREEAEELKVLLEGLGAQVEIV